MVFFWNEKNRESNANRKVVTETERKRYNVAKNKGNAAENVDAGRQINASQGRS